MTNNIIQDNKNSVDMFEMMDKAYKFAEIIAKSDIIPQHYRGKPSNVFIAVQTAYRMNLDPMLVMQNTYVVGGKLGMNTTFAISLANNSGLFTNGIRYRQEGSGKDLVVTAYTNLKKTGEEISYSFSLKMASAEGYTRNSKYQTMPELMLRYRAATLLIRTHAPEVMNGMHMVEELEDVSVSKQQEQTPKAQTLADKLAQAKSNFSGNFKSEEVQPAQIVNEQQSQLEQLILQHKVPEEVVSKWCEKAGVDLISDLDENKQLNCINYIQENYGK